MPKQVAAMNLGHEHIDKVVQIQPLRPYSPEVVTGVLQEVTHNALGITVQIRTEGHVVFPTVKWYGLVPHATVAVKDEANHAEQEHNDA